MVAIWTCPSHESSHRITVILFHLPLPRLRPLPLKLILKWPIIIMQNLYISIVNRINTKQTMEIGIPNVNMTIGSNVLDIYRL